jgi:hypothetical protein
MKKEVPGIRVYPLIAACNLKSNIVKPLLPLTWENRYIHILLPMTGLSKDLLNRVLDSLDFEEPPPLPSQRMNNEK